MVSLFSLDTSIISEKESQCKEIITSIISKTASSDNISLYSLFLSPFFTKTKFDIDLNKKKETKYKLIESILSNVFLKEYQKTELFTIFSILQKGINGIRRFVYLYRYKRSKIYNSTDLCGDPIPTNPRLSITILQNNTRYIFLLRELMKTINTSLSNSPHFFSEPVPCKNPYTNVPFNKSALYNIYFSLRFSSSIKIPELFHRYFLCDFDLFQFSFKSEDLIRTEYINSYVKNIGIHQIGYIREITHCIFREYKILCIHVHRHFPEDRLLTIMQPYISAYYRVKYTLNLTLKTHLSLILKYCLLKFVEYNKCFGRKIQKREIRSGKIVRFIDFNDKHVEFKWPVLTNFRNNHLNIASVEMSKILNYIQQSKKWDFLKIIPFITIKDSDESESEGNNTPRIEEEEEDEDEEDEEEEDEDEEEDEEEEEEQYINEGEEIGESESDSYSDSDLDSYE